MGSIVAARMASLYTESSTDGLIFLLPGTLGSRRLSSVETRPLSGCGASLRPVTFFPNGAQAGRPPVIGPLPITKPSLTITIRDPVRRVLDEAGVTILPAL